MSVSKFADDSRLNGAVDTLECRDAIQRDLGVLERWAHVNPMRFIRARFRILHLGRGNPQYQYRLGDQGLRVLQRRRTWGYWWMKDWTCAFTVQKANCVLGCIQRNMASRSGEVILASVLPS